MTHDTIEVRAEHRIPHATIAQVIDAVTAFAANPALLDGTLRIHTYHFYDVGPNWTSVPTTVIELAAITYSSTTEGHPT